MPPPKAFLRLEPLLGLLGLLSLLSGACQVHTINMEPEPLVAPPQGFMTAETEPPVANPEAAPWWESLGHEPLNKLMTEMLTSNRWIAQARHDFAAALALAEAQGAQLFPEVAAGVSATKTHYAGGADKPAGSEVTKAGLQLSWEADLFGRLRSMSLAAENHAYAVQETVAVVTLAQSVALADAYFTAVAAHRRLQLIHEQVAFDQKTLELLQLRHSRGVGTLVDVLQQQGQLTQSTSLIPVTETQVWRAENHLDTLLGGLPDGKDRIAAATNLEIAAALPTIGVPSQVILNRPDLRVAKFQLIAADAAIASAMAERLPRFTLEGQYGMAKIGGASTVATSWVAGLLQPLWDWGARQQQVVAQEARYQRELQGFTQTFIEAVAQIEGLLYSERRQRQYVAALAEREAILRRTVTEAEDRYQQGVDDYLPVLSALQQLRQLERDVLAERLGLIKLRIALHQAIGGATSAATGGNAAEMKEG